MIKKLTVFLCVFCICCACLSTSEPSTTVLSTERIKQAIRDFSEAVCAKDSVLLKQYSPNFAVSVATFPASWGYLTKIFEHETIDSIVPIADQIIAVENSFKQKTDAWVYIQGREAFKTTITFDGRDGTILYVDYFDSRFGIFRNRPSELAVVLPIEQDKDGIIVKLKLNEYDKPLRFLFDSGADGMAISAELAEKAAVKANRTQNTSVVGGTMDIAVSSGNTVHLNTFKLPNQNIAIFSTLRDDIDGLIGLNLAKNFIIKVNFDEMKMYLYTFGTYHYETDGETEQVTVPRGVIHIPGYLNLTGKKIVNGNFVFDTGADYFLMGFSPFVRSNRLLLSGFKPERQSSTVSLGIATPTYEGNAHEFGFGQTIKQTNMPVSLQASNGTKWQPGADGSVGVKLISNYNFTINLSEKELHFSPRKSHQ